ncbi:MAG TPA: S41 family peptidase [Chloroflexia bacterium]|nr:S41 family peptidase [Chloroflexia bacterium]
MDNTSRKTSPLVFIVVLVAIVAFGLGAGTMYLAEQAAGSVTGNLGARSTPGTQAGGTGEVPAELANDPAWESFVNTYNAISHEFYYRPVDKDELVYGAAKGMIEALGDDYSSFQTPVEAVREASNMQGNFEGVGITIGVRNDLPTVISPIPNTPAEKAGVRAGDVIAGVDGRDVTKFTPGEIANIVRGPAGTKVRLTLIRGDKPYDVELTRARIEVPAVTLTMVGEYAHIEMSIFNEKTTPELDAALEQALAQNAKGVILDLSNNGGGLVVQALQVLGRFLPQGSVGFYESSKADGSEDEAHQVIANAPSSLDLNKTRDIPMVVLTNGGTASASEITSGALQDYGRAKLIGEQTFGKGSEQHVYQWEDGTSAHITFAHWLTPKKRDINPRPTPTVGPGTPEPLPTFTPTPQANVPPAQATATAQARPLYPEQTDRGLTPEIRVVRSERDYLEDKDPQLDRAVEFLKTGK